MKLIPALAAICALGLPSALLADGFEGTLTMTVSTATQKDGPKSFDISSKDGKVRFDMDSPQGKMAMIMDPTGKQMIILMYKMQMFMIQPFGQVTPPPSQAASGEVHTSMARGDGSIKDTGIKETISGYVCTKYEFTGSGGKTAEIWATDQLGMFLGMPHGGPMGRGRETPPEWEGIMKGGNFFPMRVVSNDSHGTSKMEVSNVQKTSVPDSLFAAPSGWRDMGSMMGAMGGFPGMRPPGNN